MLNRTPLVVTEISDVESELKAIGLSSDLVISIGEKAAAAKASSLPIDPLSAPGTQAYIFGVRAIRMELLPRGWEMSRVGNVESTVNHELGVQLCFQNVFDACGLRNPEAVSGKGAGARQLINQGQGELFAVPLSDTQTSKRGTTPKVWFLCVSSDEHTLKIEVSCPRGFEGEQFGEFEKRILVIDRKYEPDPEIDNGPTQHDGSDAADFEVQVSKR